MSYGTKFTTDNGYFAEPMCVECDRPATEHGDGETCPTEEVTMPSTVDEFLAERAAWKAAGCPADHPYMVKAREALAAARPLFVEPLVEGFTVEMVEAAAAMRPLMPERPHWPNETLTIVDR